VTRGGGGRKLPAMVWPKVVRGASLIVGLVTSALYAPGCAEAECKYNSDCAAGLCIGGKCERECFAAIDCPKDRPACVRGTCAATEVDGGVVPDAGADASGSPDTAKAEDTSTPPVDTAVEPMDTAPPIDTSAPPADTGGGGTKGYLTACASNAECASGVCTPSAPRFCTKTCAVHGECAHGQICAGGVCRVEDTGTPCTTGSGCLQYCGGIVGASFCTHACSTATDCPAGYACTPDGTGLKICVDIERPCTDANQCPSGLGFCGAGGLGCTAKCTSAADCPQRIVGLPPYTCESVGGQSVCKAPSDVLGSSVMGSTCPATGTNTCRSGACDTSTSPPTCVQRCSARGGCAVSWGCYPVEDPSTKTADLICSPAGSVWLGQTCARGRDCQSGICQSPGYCTRMCADGFCPDGMTCGATGLTATDGTPVKLCNK
jgi:hypothetical protein